MNASSSYENPKLRVKGVGGKLEANPFGVFLSSYMRDRVMAEKAAR
jgi:hypothetical protein